SSAGRCCVASPDRVSDTHGSGERDAVRDHEKDRGYLQRDLMCGKCRAADPPYEDCSGGEQAPFERQGAGNRQSDCGELAHEGPVRMPEAAEHVVFLEWATGAADPDRGNTHGNID